ncbi:helix-turn-helix domain-containing protein [Burkholderia anthina]|uniref:helix-turn-helix domain-containing protein n=1 Tax=Burkholderia anthina TaxID=179879 RepID=UPI0037C12F6E
MEGSQNVQHSRKLISKIGPYLAERRKEKGWTQSVMSEKLAIAEESLSRLESGRVTPTIERLIQFCDLLDLSLEEVLMQVSANPSDQASSLVTSLQDLSPAQRDLVLGTARHLADMIREQNGDAG